MTVKFLKILSRDTLLFLLVVALILPINRLVHADTATGGWLADGNPELKSTELAPDYVPPYSINYNTDCNTTNFDVVIREAKPIPVAPFSQTELRHRSECAVSTPRGLSDGMYLDAGLPAGKLAGFSGTMALAPGLQSFMSLQVAASSSSLEATIWDAIVPQYNLTTGEVQFNVANPHFLADRAGNKIYLRPGSMAYSGDGRWMVADSSVGFIRVEFGDNGETITPFAGGFTYGSGFDPAPRVAVSPDGRYAAVASGSTTFKIYDLNTCSGETPTAITGPLSCQFKDIQPFMANTFNSYIISYYIRFASPEFLTFVVAYRDSSGTVKKTQIRMAPHGQTIEDVTYLALGDSFSSGEGAYDYELGTDEPENKCHLSKNSYPYLVAAGLRLSDFHSVACSGALSEHYFYKAQHDLLKPFTWLAGESTQERFVEQAHPNAITISMIGNDIGFKDKIVRCLWVDSCLHFKEDRQNVVEEINGKFWKLVDLYEDIRQKSDGASVYVLGYPQLFSTVGECRFSISLDTEEREAAKGLVGYLNAVIKAATERAGVQYIDIENSFQDHLLCGDGKDAANGLTSGDDIGAFGVNFIGNESFHPNKLGHQLMADQLLEQSWNFTKPMPTPTTASIPGSSSQAYANFIANAPSGGRLFRIAYTGGDMINGVLKNKAIGVDITNILNKPNSVFEAWFNSEPTFAGTLTTDEQGELHGDITVPDSLEPGFHTLHLYGKDLANKDIDLYQTIYVAESADDYDGDGILNQDEQCLVTEPIGVDQDRDGIDDACDPEIGDAPADTTPPIVTGTPDREPDANGWYNHDVTISWDATDPEPSSGAPSQPVATIADQDGVQTYTSDQSCDPLNNCATGSLELKIDKSAPILGAPAWTGNPKSAMGTAEITLPVTDNLSGITEAEYYLGDTDPGEGNGATMQVSDGTLSVGFNTDFPTGVYKVTMRAKDVAGNWSAPVTEYIVVYDPFGTRMTGKRTILPSFANGDILPGLIAANQDDTAKFGFNVRYDKTGRIDKNSDFQFTYKTGTMCHKPSQAQNCHTFELNATSVAWFATQGQNDSTGIFQGTAKLEVDGTINNVLFRLTGLDGERLDGISDDHLSLKVYAAGANPNVDIPIYRAEADLQRGNIKIRRW